MTIATFVLLGAAATCFLARAIVGPSLVDRVVAIDGLIITFVAIVLSDSIRTRSSWFMAVAVVVAFVGFVGTTAAARFIERRGG